jgi:flagellar biosynthesis/type III secretory pathway M-ring protein FliF/YscJ
VRKLLTWLVVTVGVAALVRKLRSRSRPAATDVEEAPEGENPAEELRQKLADSRAETPAAAAPSEPEPSVEERRSEVHDQGRAAIDEMQRSTED